jgi:hypothetical protein
MPDNDPVIESDDPQQGLPNVIDDDEGPRFVPAEELAARAENWEAQFLEGMPAPVEGEGDAAAPATPAAAPAEESPIKALLEQQSELLEEIKSLKAGSGPGKGGAPEDPFAAALAESPEITQLDTEITSIANSEKHIVAAQTALFNKLALAQEEMLVATGKLEQADPEDKPSLRQELAEKTRVRDEINRQMERNEERANSNKAQLGSLRRQRATAEAGVRRAVEARAEERQTFSAQVQSDRAEFIQALSEEAKAYGIDQKSVRFAKLTKDIANEIHIFTSRQLKADPNAPGVDIPAAVKLLMKQAAEAYNLGPRQELTAASRARLNNRTAAKPGTRLPTPQQQQTPGRDRPYTLEEVRARRDAILGGGRG